VPVGAVSNICNKDKTSATVAQTEKQPCLSGPSATVPVGAVSIWLQRDRQVPPGHQVLCGCVAGCARRRAAWLQCCAAVVTSTTRAPCSLRGPTPGPTATQRCGGRAGRTGGTCPCAAADLRRQRGVLAVSTQPGLTRRSTHASTLQETTPDVPVSLANRWDPAGPAHSRRVVCVCV
jgi:hypothetical protein